MRIDAADDAYTVREVRRLLGIDEDPHSDGDRYVTFCDLFSWATDPGGERFRYRRELEAGNPEAWRFLRGPLNPGSDEAAVLWDFLRAMKRFDDVRDRAILALTFFGFSSGEIAHVMYGNRRQYKSVNRKLHGRTYRDAEGEVTHRTPGLVKRLTDFMNGEPS